MKRNHRFSLPKRIFYKITVGFQWMLWKMGVSWHNSFFDECTPDFSCCINKYPVGSEERYILGQISEAMRHKQTILHLPSFKATRHKSTEED